MTLPTPAQDLLAAQVTPVVLTSNEEANLGRTLEALRWAPCVLVLDSGSTDGTEAIARAHPNVVWAVRPFDGWEAQWTAAFQHPAVRTPYVLALDADMAPTPQYLAEAQARVVAAGKAAGRARFLYRVGGRDLMGSLYPADTRLLRRESTTVSQVGHGHRFLVQGEVVSLRARLVHDDRKPWARFVASQMAYVEREQARIHAGQHLRLRDRLRRWGLMPLPILLLAWLRAGGPFTGRAALRYAWERAFYETLLALRLRTPDARDGREPRA